MHTKTLTVRSGQNNQYIRYVTTEDGQRLNIPDDWDLLPPGDAAITRKLKALGPTWTAQRRRGRKVFSDGVWAPKENIGKAKKLVAETRSDPAYAKKRKADTARREKKHQEYVEDFRQGVLDYLRFPTAFSDLAGKMATLITEHATPVGSGTVARTERIPLEQRVEAAVLAWMRHHTTEYDSTYVPRIKGKRREIRRAFAADSRKLLDSYRRGIPPLPEKCPLQRAVSAAG